MEIFTSRRRTDNNRELLIAAYREGDGSRGIESIPPRNTLNCKFIILKSKRYFHGKHAK
jgi:hypothetical protein